MTLSKQGASSHDTRALAAGTDGRGQGAVRVLMSPPDAYGIRYTINPWMERRLPVHHARACTQWRELYRVVREETFAEVELAPPAPGLPDFVFAANAGLVIDDTFIPSRFRHSERAWEEPYWKAVFERAGYAVRELPGDLRFEGEGDVLPCGEDLLAAGYGFRSDREAVLHLGEVLEMDVLPLQLADPWFYHLDTCFCPLPDGGVLYYPQAFTPASRDAIESAFQDAIVVPRTEARRFACNSVVIGDHVVVGPGCPRTRAELEKRGYTVHEVDVSEFLKAGGGAKCMVLFVERGMATASTASQPDAD